MPELKNIPFARILQPSNDRIEGDSLVLYQKLNLPPASKSLAVTNCGALAGGAVTKTLTSGATALEVGDLTKTIVLNWHKSFEGNESLFGSSVDTFTEVLAADNYDLIAVAGQPRLFPVPPGAVAYTYDNVGTAGTPIIIER